MLTPTNTYKMWLALDYLRKKRFTQENQAEAKQKKTLNIWHYVFQVEVNNFPYKEGGFYTL